MILIFLWPRLKPWLTSNGARGSRVLPSSATGVAGRRWRFQSGASYCCRISVNVVFMAAFDLSVTAYTRRAGCLFACSPGLFAIPRWGWADAGARRCHARQTRSDRECRRILGHARLDSDDVERCSRRRAHALGLRLRRDQAAAIEDTPGSRQRARLHLDQSLPRPGSASLCEPRRTMEGSISSPARAELWHEPAA